MPKVLLITNSYPLAEGAPSLAAPFARAMARALVGAGARVRVLTPDREGPKPDDPGIDVEWFEWTGSRVSALASLSLTSPGGWRHVISLAAGGRLAVIRACEAFRPDACLAAWALPSGYFAHVAKGRLGVPYAVWCLGSDIHTYARKPGLSWLTRRVLRGADLLYADGFALADDASALCGRAVSFLASATTLPLEAPIERPLLEAGKVHFLYAGRWEPVKGLDVLLDAWRILASSGKTEDAVLHVAGSGAGLAEAVRKTAADERVGGSLAVVGWVEGGELASLLRRVDCVVLPSRRESIPVVLSEAVQAGKPLIVTDVGDMGTIVERYGLGRVVPPEDPGRLADTLAEFIENPHRPDAAKLAEAAALFDLERAARRVLDDFGTLRGEEPPGG